MTFKNTNSSGNQLRGKIPSLSETKVMSAEHIERHEKIEIELSRKDVVKAFDHWKLSKSPVKRIKITATIPRTNTLPRKVQEELKELGYGIEFRAGKWYVSWK